MSYPACPYCGSALEMEKPVWAETIDTSKLTVFRAGVCRNPSHEPVRLHWTEHFRVERLTAPELTNAYALGGQR